MSKRHGEAMANIRAILSHQSARSAFRKPCTVAVSLDDGQGHIHFSCTDEDTTNAFLVWCAERGIEPVQEPEVIPLLCYDAYVSAQQAMEFRLRWSGAES